MQTNTSTAAGTIDEIKNELQSLQFEELLEVHKFVIEKKAKAAAYRAETLAIIEQLTEEEKIELMIEVFKMIEKRKTK